MSSERRQMSYTASLSRMTATSVCSRREWVERTELYGSTTAGGNLWGWVDGETKLGLLTIIDGESLEEERSETGSGTTTDGIEDEETLKTSALIGKLSDSVEAEINDF